VKKAFRKFLRNPVNVILLVVLLIFVLLAVLAPWVAPYDPYEVNMRNRFQMPSTDHWLGTDEAGRDILSRILYGARISLTIGLVSTGIAFVVGGFLGLLAGYYPALDNPVMRVMDILLAIPTILLAIAIVAALGPGLYNLMIAIGIGIVPTFARITRSAVLPLRSADFVDAARAIGANDPYILRRSVAPNAVAPILVYATLSLGTAVLSAAILNFLGIGLDPVLPEWGAMASAGRNYLRQAPHITFVPSLTIFLVVISFNLLGDQLRDFLDPKQKT